MSQRYVIFEHDSKPEEPVVLITNLVLDNENFPITSDMNLISAGTVTFCVDSLGHASVDVTHGNTALGITVNLEQMAMDKLLLSKLFL